MLEGGKNLQETLAFLLRVVVRIHHDVMIFSFVCRENHSQFTFIQSKALARSRAKSHLRNQLQTRGAKEHERVQEETEHLREKVTTRPDADWLLIACGS